MIALAACCDLIQVNNAAEEERRKCEAEKVEAVQMHCGILEEQSRKSLESLTSEQNKSLALQHQVVELKTVRCLTTMCKVIILNTCEHIYMFVVFCMIFLYVIRECWSWSVKVVHSKKSRSLYWLQFANH